jgi:hypothetical protein
MTPAWSADACNTGQRNNPPGTHNAVFSRTACSFSIRTKTAFDLDQFCRSPRRHRQVKSPQEGGFLMFDKKTFIYAGFAATLFVAVGVAVLLGNGGLNGRDAYASMVGFINGNLIPPGTSRAQVPSRHEEDNYGTAAGKD